MNLSRARPFGAPRRARRAVRARHAVRRARGGGLPPSPERIATVAAASRLGVPARLAGEAVPGIAPAPRVWERDPLSSGSTAGGGRDCAGVLVGEPRRSGGVSRSRASRWRSPWGSRLLAPAPERPDERIVAMLAGQDAKPVLLVSADRGGRFLTVKAVGPIERSRGPLARAVGVARRRRTRAPLGLVPAVGVARLPLAAPAEHRPAEHPGARDQPRAGGQARRPASRPDPCSTPARPAPVLTFTSTSERPDEARPFCGTRRGRDGAAVERSSIQPACESAGHHGYRLEASPRVPTWRSTSRCAGTIETVDGRGRIAIVASSGGRAARRETDREHTEPQA